MKLFLTLLLVFVLAGCATRPEVVTETKEIPVQTKCVPQTTLTVVNVMPLDTAKKEMSLYEKLKLAIQEVEILTGQKKELLAALSECTK